MRKTIVFCVECGKQNDTDFMYIMKAVHRWFLVDNNIVIRPIYMNSITRYRDSKTIKEIKDYIKYGNNTTIVYCVDTDDYNSNPHQQKLFEDIKRYCKDNDYDFVFFCRDVEHVFLGKQLNDTDKTKEAKAFSKNDSIDKVSEDSLSSETIRDMHSNLLCVLDKYMTRK